MSVLTTVSSSITNPSRLVINRPTAGQIRTKGRNYDNQHWGLFVVIKALDDNCRLILKEDDICQNNSCEYRSSSPKGFKSHFFCSKCQKCIRWIGCAHTLQHFDKKKSNDVHSVCLDKWKHLYNVHKRGMSQIQIKNQVKTWKETVLKGWKQPAKTRKSTAGNIPPPIFSANHYSQSTLVSNQFRSQSNETNETLMICQVNINNTNNTNNTTSTTHNNNSHNNNSNNNNNNNTTTSTNNNNNNNSNNDNNSNSNNNNNNNNNNNSNNNNNNNSNSNNYNDVNIDNNECQTDQFRPQVPIFDVGSHENPIQILCDSNNKKNNKTKTDNRKMDILQFDAINVGRPSRSTTNKCFKQLSTRK